MIRRLRAAAWLKQLTSGRTKPCVMLCEDDAGKQEEVVVKLCSRIETRETGLICELLASLLALDLDLPVPEPVVVAVDPAMAQAMPQPEAAGAIRDSAGLNFGSKKLPSGFATWPKDKPIPLLMRPLASEILAFDAIIQNPDRRRDNPIVLWKGDELFIYDHELGFSFVLPIIGWQPPWSGQGLEFLRQHVFFDGLTGTNPNWDRLTGAWEAVPAERW